MTKASYSAGHGVRHPRHPVFQFVHVSKQLGNSWGGQGRIVLTKRDECATVEVSARKFRHKKKNHARWWSIIWRTTYLRREGNCCCTGGQFINGMMGVSCKLVACVRSNHLHAVLMLIRFFLIFSTHNTNPQKYIVVLNHRLFKLINAQGVLETSRPLSQAFV